MSDNENKDLYCSFCSSAKHEVGHLITGPEVYICDECISMCSALLAKKKREEQAENGELVESTSDFNVLTPQEIFDKLSEAVVGQDYAKKVLSVAAYNHYKRIHSKSEIGIDKSNILLIGPTGCGKTLLAKTLAKILDVPFAITDATTLTEAGYVGEDVENLVKRLLQASDNDIEKAERGIIFVDEIDKISRKSENPSITKDVGGEGVQQALLKLIEGSVVNVGKGKRKNPEEDATSVDTSNILFICSGAFQGIEKIVNSRTNSNSGIGITAQLKDESKDKNLTEVMKNVKPEDLTKFGLIPEFIGRLPVIASLSEVDEETLVKILTEPKDSIVKQYAELFKYENVGLEFNEDALQEIAKVALERRTGARGLKSIVENTLIDTMFKAPSVKGLEKVVVTKKSIQRTEEPELVIANA